MEPLVYIYIYIYMYREREEREKGSKREGMRERGGDREGGREREDGIFRTELTQKRVQPSMILHTSAAPITTCTGFSDGAPRYREVAVANRTGRTLPPPPP